MNSMHVLLGLVTSNTKLNFLTIYPRKIIIGDILSDDPLSN